MALPNDSINVTPGAGATLAMHLISSKKYPVTVDSDKDGLISVPEYISSSGPIASATNSVEYINLFNSSSTAIVKVKGMWLIYNGGAFTIATPVEYAVDIISTAGIGGVQSPIRKLDSTDATLSSIVVKAGQTAAGGATSVHELWRTYLFPVQTAMDINMMGFMNQIPKLREEDPSIVLRQNEGIRVRMITSSTIAPTMTGLIHFSVQ